MKYAWLWPWAMGLSLLGCGQQEPIKADYLPWEIQQTPEGHTEVFHIALGQSTLKDLITTWQRFPELAVFINADQSQQLEAYFGKKRLGVLEAKVVAELEADKTTLDSFVAQATDRKGQASGAWRLSLTEKAVQAANGLLVKYLVYMPVADYAADMMRQRFGEPNQTLPATENAEYWLYPGKGLIILLNYEGGEIFYYSAAAQYDALKQRLVQQAKASNDRKK